jgi:Spy/CpxP family protein refolding chaperone
MRMRNALIALALIALSSLAAQAQAPGGPGFGRGMMMMGSGDSGLAPLMMFLRAADLTPAQKTQVQKIEQDSRAQLGPLLKQLRSTREAIADKLAGTGAVTASDLAPLQQQAAQAQQSIEAATLSMALQIRALLTPDQLARIAAAHDKLKSIRAEMEGVFGPKTPPKP